MPSFLTFSVFFLFLLTATIATISSSATPTAYDILESNGLPKGLLPDSVKNYTIPDKGSGEFAVTLNAPCYVQFDTISIYFDTSITGTLVYGSFKNIRGIDVGKLFLWLPVNGIALDSDKKEVAINLGRFSLNRPFSEFETIPTCEKSHQSGSRKNTDFSLKSSS